MPEKLPPWLAEIEHHSLARRAAGWPDATIRGLLELAKAQHEVILRLQDLCRAGGFVDDEVPTTAELAPFERALRLWEGGE